MNSAHIIQLSHPIRDVKVSRTGHRQALHDEDLEISFHNGRVEGERALSEQLVRQRAELMELQTGVFTSLKNIFPKLTRDCEQALVALALEVARKLVAGTPISAEMIETSVREACAEMEQAAEYCVRLNPEDYAMLQRANSPLLVPGNPGEKLRVETAQNVSRGGCIVETPFGIIDGRIETRLERLHAALQP